MQSPNPSSQGVPSPSDALRARERTLRLLESVEDLSAEILISATGTQSRLADEAARLAGDAEHAVLDDLHTHPDAVSVLLVRIRRRLRVLHGDIVETRHPTPPVWRGREVMRP